MLIAIAFANISNGFLYRNPTQNDSAYFIENPTLMYSPPAERNFHEYYNLACKLYNVGRFNEAIPMFKAIEASTLWQYNYNYHHTLADRGDTTVPIHGYGGLTYNYKHEACLYLVRSYLVIKQFKEALAYLNLVNSTYTTRSNSGEPKLRDLFECDYYSCQCYYRLGMYDSVIVKFISKYTDWMFCKELLKLSIKELYSPEEIQQELIKAENSFTCRIDSNIKVLYMEGYDSKDSNSSVWRYPIIEATCTLFNQHVNLYLPKRISMGATKDKETILSEFKSCEFYKDLWNAGNAQN